MRVNLSVCLAMTGLATLSLLLGTSWTATAAAAPAETKTEKYVPPSEQSVAIVLHPMAEPRPALKYQLLPPVLDQHPGNAAVWWNRLPAERLNWLQAFYGKDGAYEKLREWVKIPLHDPKAAEYRREHLTAQDLNAIRSGPMFDDMDRAARFESCDWELPFRDGNIVAMMLPDLQQLRSWARMLQCKAHLEIADGHYDEAIRTLQSGYALARHAAQGPTLIHGLVGVTVAGMMCDEVEQWLQQPNAPDLYWALSILPRPLIDFRRGGEIESDILRFQFPELRHLENQRLSADQWRQLLLKVAHGVAQLSANAISPEQTQALVTVWAIQGYPKAKAYLIANGQTPAEVEAMPVAQAVLLASLGIYDELRDERFKWFFLPPAEGKDGLARAVDTAYDDAKKRETFPLASLFVPACGAVKEAETRLAWRFATLRILEALRLYAAAHDGRWPDRLSDITEVPVPLNPFDGQPFVYERQGDKATLTVKHGPAGMPWRYEITFAK